MEALFSQKKSVKISTLFNCFLTSVFKVNLTIFQLFFDVSIQGQFDDFSTVFWRQYWRSIWRLFNWFSTSKIRLSRSKISEKKSYIFNFVLTIYWRHYVTSIWRHFDEYVHMGKPRCAHPVNLTSKSRHFLVGWSMTKFWLKINCLLIFKAEFSCGLKFLWDSLQFWLFLIFTIMQK